MLIGALSLLALIGSPIASASAAETSQITSPAGPTYALYDETAPSSITVSGTTNINGNIALRCYYGQNPNEYTLVANEVKTSAGAFSVEVKTESLYSGPCVLRAVPVADKEAHPPGSASEEAADPFQGPRIVGSRFELFPEDGHPYAYDYEAESSTLSGYFDIESVGDCGLDYSRLFAPISLAPSDYLFDCNAFIYAYNFPASGPSTRSELQIDGANAYSPPRRAALKTNSKSKPPSRALRRWRSPSPSNPRRASSRFTRSIRSSSAHRKRCTRRPRPAARASSRPGCSSNGPGRRATPTTSRG